MPNSGSKAPDVEAIEARLDRLEAFAREASRWLRRHRRDLGLATDAIDDVQLAASRTADEVADLRREVDLG
jgi:hypothetical protein